MLAMVRSFVNGILLILLISSAASAQNVRSAVSVTGVDTNNCAVLAPCRTFAAAIAQTNDGGEVIVLSSGGYGPFGIFKSISIVSPAGIHAALAPTSGDAIAISGTDISVFLRNLWINGLGAPYGIHVYNAKQVHVEGCTVTGFVVDAINYSPLTGGSLAVMDSFLRSSQYGARFGPGGPAQITVDRTRIENNNRGIEVLPTLTGSAYTVISDSIITANIAGVAVPNFSEKGPSETNVERCVVAHNPLVGIQGGGPSKLVRVSNSYITNNGIGVQSVGGSDMISFGNNLIHGNGTDGAFTSTILPR